jgi:hypothetical protein
MDEGPNKTQLRSGQRSDALRSATKRRWSAPRVIESEIMDTSAGNSAASDHTPYNGASKS